MTASRLRRGVGPGLALLVLVPAAGRAQVRIEDLVFTGGVSAEAYDGNFSAVTVPVVDSTDHATAAVGEFGARGALTLVETMTGGTWDHSLSVDFDAGFRQFAAAGFEIRDYAPREWVGRVDVSWWQRLGRAGTLTLAGTVRTRSVEDRPPMPLFLQPGYSTVRGALVFRTYEIQGVGMDVQLDVQHTDYEAVSVLSRLSLLDRRSAGLEVGAQARRESWRMRFYGGYRESEYPHQDSFDPSDPFRRDRTFHMGALWTLESAVRAELGVEGTVNRSNSNRPEYDAVSVRGSFTAALPWWEMGLNVFGLLTGKTYVHESPFVRLVPGEEANNASVAYLELNRPLAPNLTTALRFGWTRAETDVGESYYSRFGTSLLFNFRP